ncbi:MAG: ACP S-malonyltransferase [Planctomycetes bacterium]|nr:ACP S-malonyltransferase [Planctomycetota bacterium]
MSQEPIVILCPGQGAQAVGMGKAWRDASDAAASTFREADEILANSLGAPLSELCFEGPAEKLNRTDITQPGLYVCGVASYRGMVQLHGPMPIAAAAGLSLGEYTALHLAGAFDFAQGLKLVALRGKLMQEAAEAIDSSMVALIGADEEQAQAICDEASQGEVLVTANFNAPGQIVLSGHTSACNRAVQAAQEKQIRATSLTVAGAFHSPLMQSAADKLGEALASITIGELKTQVWSNVTGKPHDPHNPELIRQRLVEQIINPVRWDETCQQLALEGTMEFRELAPSGVLRGLMRRINRNVKVHKHDEP